MLTKKDKELILKAFETVDVHQMGISHGDERMIKWFRFGSYSGMKIAQDIIKEMPERKTTIKNKVS